MTIDQQIHQIKNYPTGLTRPVIAEIINSLEILKNTFTNNNSHALIRSMSVTEARQFDEFKKFQQFNANQ